MQLGNRLFPYPVLNSMKELSNFQKDVSFELSITLDQRGQIMKNRDNVILKDVHFKLDDEDLLCLFHEGKIACYLIVESPSSIYRQKFVLTDVPQTYQIPLGKLKDDVYLSAYCYATCDIHNYFCKFFEEDFKDYVFDLKKYDIVAADDGMKFVLERDLDEDNKVSSIFVIVKSEDNTNTISYDMKSDKIYIYLPRKQHEYYGSLKVTSEWNDIFFSMIAIPVLTACFSDLKSIFKEENYDFQLLLENYRWFKSVMKSYKKEKGIDLSDEEFQANSSLELAQIVFNYSSINGITKFFELVNHVGESEDE